MKIGWYLIGDRQIASARQIGFLIHEWINKNTDITSIILYHPNGYNPILSEHKIDTSCDIVLFQKVCMGSAVSMIKEYRKCGIKTVYIIDDLIIEGVDMCKEAEYVVSGDASSYLQEFVKSTSGKIATCLPNPIETPIDFYKEDYTSNNPLKVVWFGTEMHIMQAWEINDIIKKLGYKYEVICSGQMATKQWALNTIFNDIKAADIVVLPYLHTLPPYELAKGANRAIQAMAIGLPVIASPLPSYIVLIRHGKNGFIAMNNDLDDWEMYLKMLGHQSIREIIGKEARKSVISIYNIDAVGEVWKAYLKGIL
jgi:glycosyltransferase involved in cell wall biosynthesis